MNGLTQLTSLAVHYVRTVVGARLTRFAEARQRGELGASAIELAIITAVLVALAVAIVAIISNVVQSKCQTIAGQGGVAGSCP
jgi:Flp pilus assembly protein TadG